MCKTELVKTTVSVPHPCGESGCKRNAPPYHMLCKEHMQELFDRAYKITRYKAI